MYTLQWMKFNERWRRLAWRLNGKTYATFVGSTVLTLAFMRTIVSHAGPGDSREWRAMRWSVARAVLAAVGDGKTIQWRTYICRPTVWFADQARVAADGTYMRRKYAEVYDNPLYR